MNVIFVISQKQRGEKIGINTSNLAGKWGWGQGGILPCSRTGKELLPAPAPFPNGSGEFSPLRGRARRIREIPALLPSLCRAKFFLGG